MADIARSILATEMAIVAGGCFCGCERKEVAAAALVLDEASIALAELAVSFAG